MSRGTSCSFRRASHSFGVQKRNVCVKCCRYSPQGCTLYRLQNASCNGCYSSRTRCRTRLPALPNACRLSWLFQLNFGPQDARNIAGSRGGCWLPSLCCSPEVHRCSFVQVFLLNKAEHCSSCNRCPNIRCFKLTSYPHPACWGFLPAQKPISGLH